MTVASMPMWSAGDAVHVPGSGGHAAKDIAAAHHDADLHAGCGHVGDFARQRLDPLGINAESRRLRPTTSPLSFSRMRL